MALGRRESSHSTQLSALHSEAAVQGDYAPGQRVMTCDGIPGVVASIEFQPLMGAELYQVNLDGGAGGGLYSSSQLTPIASHVATGVHLASEDYPELDQILQERPDIALPTHMGSLQAEAAVVPTFQNETEDYGGTAFGEREKLHAHHPETGERMGTLTYLVPRRKSQKLRVEDLTTRGEHRRQGVGSALMDEMQRRHPGQGIDHGDRTDNGKAWWNSYTDGKSVNKGRTMASLHTASEDEDYRMHHRPLEDGPPAHDMGSGMAGDVYTHPHYWASGGTPSTADREGLAQLRKAKGNPEHPVTIYRASPPGAPHVMNTGDWVSLSHSYAKEHAGYRHEEDGGTGEAWTVHKATVPAKHVRDAGTDVYKEQGYWGPSVPSEAHTGRTAALDPYTEADMFGPQEEQHVAGRGKPRADGRGAGPGADPEDQFGGAQRAVDPRDEHVGQRVVGAAPVTFHPAAMKELKKLDNQSRKQVGSVITDLEQGRPTQTHQLGDKLKGWSSTKASRGHRIVHRKDEDGSHYIGHVGLHEYETAIRRLTSQQDGGFEDIGDASNEDGIVSDGLAPSMGASDAEAMAGSGGHYDDGTEWAEDGYPTDGRRKAAFNPYTALTEAAFDPEFRFHFTSAWSDVRAKAKRIRAEGGVRITLASDGLVIGEVKGDHHVYETGVQRFPGSRNSIATYSCGCKWGAYHWGASDDFSRFAGRMCSHALALQFEAQSKGMFGRDIVPETRKPEWVPKKVVVKYDIDDGDNRFGKSSTLEVTPLLALARWARANGDDLEEFAFAVAASGLGVLSNEQLGLFDEHPYKQERKAAEPVRHAESEPDEGPEEEEDGDGRRFHRDEYGDPVYKCHNKYCTEGEHSSGETKEAHETAFTDWDQVHPHIGPEVHRGMAVTLPAHVHRAVHDDSAPMEERAHALTQHMGKQGLGSHWTPEEHMGRHYAAVSSRGHGDTEVVLHAHTPAKEHIETDPDELAKQDVIGMGEHEDTEVPLRFGAPVHLKGISWKSHEGDWHRHDFHGSVTHEAAVNSPWGDPQPQAMSYQPGPTKPPNPSDNPGSAGWATMGDPDSWDSITPNELGDRVGHLEEELAFEAAIPQEVAQGDNPQGLQGLDDADGWDQMSMSASVTIDLSEAAREMFRSAFHDGGPDRPSGPKGGTGGDMPPGHAGMPEHDVLSKGPEATLNMEPEGALPFTDGDSGVDLSDDESLTPSHTAAVGLEALQAMLGHLNPAGAAPEVTAADATAYVPEGDIAAAARQHLAKVAVKDYSPSEQAAIINEGKGVRAANLDRLDIKDTHYAHLDEEDGDGSWLN